ncbi:hypothetical protein QBZ16_003828 [Prototheca wickerhamii]|uniref:FAR-17a/AIG1-like protein n=1 Tax=Prototheca wickerhamii TaxID=3111 RepID=A0AAD9IJU4_PROWI|nr:hypothetical protein QBZ16_003828 [Prototheca wickerhamii]
MSFIFHVLCTLIFTRVWLWHFTPEAAELPGSKGFGWFFRYLTFCSYTLQMALFVISCLCQLVGKPQTRRRLERASDRLACALFPIACTVSLMYYALESTTQGLVERGGFNRPDWLDFAVHGGNSLAAWGDLLLAPSRSFSTASLTLSIGLGMLYLTWCMVVRIGYGKFPYPILNKLPFPHGLLGMAGAALVLIIGWFYLGLLVRRLVRGGRKPATATATKKAD